MGQQSTRDDEIKTKMEEYERLWFAAHRRAEAARRVLADAPSEEGRRVLDQAEREQHNLMQMIEVLEDSLLL